MIARFNASAADREAVERMLGRPASAAFRVVVRREDGQPVVIENEPYLSDGAPMPTLYWLVDPEISAAVGRLESEGGVRRIEGLVDPEALERAHADYERRRDSLTSPGGHARPSGGVGGTRRGVKCLHAHLAHLLAGHADPVGEVVAAEIELPTLVREPAP